MEIPRTLIPAAVPVADRSINQLDQDAPEGDAMKPQSTNPRTLFSKVSNIGRQFVQGWQIMKIPKIGGTVRRRILMGMSGRMGAMTEGSQKRREQTSLVPSDSARRARCERLSSISPPRFQLTTVDNLRKERS